MCPQDIEWRFGTGFMPASESFSATAPSVRRSAQQIRSQCRMKTFLILLVAAGMGVVGWRLGNDRVPIEIPTRDGIREAAAAGNLGLQPFERKDTLRVTGEVQPAEQTEVKGEVGGRIKTVRVRPGDQVKTGDVLMEIDNLEADLAAEDVQLTKATVRAPTDGSIVSVPVIQGQIIAPPAEGRG